MSNDNSGQDFTTKTLTSDTITSWPEFIPQKIDVKVSVEKLDVAYIKCPHCGKPIAVTVTLNTEGVEEDKNET